MQYNVTEKVHRNMFIYTGSNKQGANFQLAWAEAEEGERSDSSESSSSSSSSSTDREAIIGNMVFSITMTSPCFIRVCMCACGVGDADVMQGQN